MSPFLYRFLPRAQTLKKSIREIRFFRTGGFQSNRRLIEIIFSKLKQLLLNIDTNDFLFINFINDKSNVFAEFNPSYIRVFHMFSSWVITISKSNFLPKIDLKQLNKIERVKSLFVKENKILLNCLRAWTRIRSWVIRV